MMNLPFQPYIRTFFSIFVLLVILPKTVRPNGFRNPPDGPSLGRIGGKTAHVDDASAISLNPANLTELTEPAALGSATLIYADTTFHSSAGQELTTKQPVKVLPSFFAALPIDDARYVLALGAGVPPACS